MTAHRPGLTTRRGRRARSAGAHKHRVRAAAAVALLAVAVTACSPGPAATSPYDPVPRTVGQTAPAADVAGWSVPLSWDGAPAVDPGWDQRPQELDGVFLGLQIPEEVGHPLRYVAVDSQGTVLWTAERPPTCTGFALSRAAGVPVAVLTDLDADASTTATAYDLRSGERVWGPVDVPGAHQGPGLVFAEPAPALGATGPRVALDPATGDVVADEAQRSGLTVVGEFDGVVLTSHDGTLQGVDAASGRQRWSIPLGDAGIGAGSSPTARPGTEPPDGTALLAGRDGRGTEAVGALVQTDDGSVVTTDAGQAVQDPATGVYVVLGATSLRGLRGQEVLWSVEGTGTTSLAAAGGALVYVRAGESLAIRNALTGAEAVAYDGVATAGFAVPAVVSTSGAAVARTDGYVLLTAPPGGG